MWELQVSVLSSSKEALERDVGALMGVHRAPCSTFMPEGSLALLEAGTLQVRYLTLGSSGHRLQRSLLCSEEHPLRHPCLFLAMTGEFPAGTSIRKSSAQLQGSSIFGNRILLSAVFASAQLSRAPQWLTAG